MNATDFVKLTSLFYISCKKFLIMKKMIVNFGKIQFIKIDPHVVLLFLVVAFFILLFATENIVKYTLIP